MQELIRVCCGTSERLERVLKPCLPAGTRNVTGIGGEDLRGKRLLFTIHVDKFGPDAAFYEMVRTIRTGSVNLQGTIGGIVVDGESESDTKAMARELALYANMAGCTFPGKPLVEATGSLKNFAVRQKRTGARTLEEAYAKAVEELTGHVLTYAPERFSRPRVLMVHASDSATSNTLAIGERVLAYLGPCCDTEWVSLRNGTISDCRGCSYTVCAHFAERNSCFYGGSITDDMFPAVLRADALLLLCPNYNDAVGANIMAFINRMTSLTVNDRLAGKRLYAVFVSGYSGGDLVAEQVLGSLCLNKSFTLPDRFCLMETANNPGEAMAQPGIEARIAALAERMRAELCL